MGRTTVCELSTVCDKMKQVTLKGNEIFTSMKSRDTRLQFRIVGMKIKNQDFSKVKVIESRNRPGVAQRVSGGLGSQISMTFGTWRWWGCQLHAPAAFTPRKRSWYSFSLGAESTLGPRYGRKEYVTEKSSVTTGNRLVAPRLNHYATPGPDFSTDTTYNYRHRGIKQTRQPECYNI